MSDNIHRLIERSSLGTPQARTARNRVSTAAANRVIAASKSPKPVQQKGSQKSGG